MDLFRNESANWLPRDGEVNYYGCIFARALADRYLNELLSTIQWRNDEAVMFGKLIVTSRKVAWYGDRPFEYTYSNTTKRALPWTPGLV
ncbi:MAG: alpha-ketoglutarate-dependent dioxygenase AlkB, partial [Cyclobacteriaceae bacterium]|nr:alpha-ketoglutarate-dependent dioxygenase AlkB [Cyclobacteriaceae bacterium]